MKITNEGWYNPGVFLEKLQAVLEKSDICEFVDENVEKLVSRNNQITGVVLKNNVQIEGDKYVLAAGAASQDIIENSSLKDLMQRIFYGVGMTIELSNLKIPNRTASHLIGDSTARIQLQVLSPSSLPIGL